MKEMFLNIFINFLLPTSTHASKFGGFSRFKKNDNSFQKLVEFAT
jgi:hypothetical protein